MAASYLRGLSSNVGCLPFNLVKTIFADVQNTVSEQAQNTPWLVLPLREKPLVTNHVIGTSYLIQDIISHVSFRWDYTHRILLPYISVFHYTLHNHNMLLSNCLSDKIIRFALSSLKSIESHFCC
jgi:hypothetical protein